MTKFDDHMTVGTLARAAGVTVRTLHHYDALGVLTPAWIAPNGYRHYGRAEALRLQEILFYRAAGMPLAEIAVLLDGPEPPVLRLSRHRDRIAAERDRLAGVLETLDATIAHLKGETTMALEDLYTPFPPEAQAAYEAWLVEVYGPDMAERIAEAKARLSGDGTAMAESMADLRAAETRLTAAYRDGVDPSSSALDPALDAHRAVVARMWGRDCEPDAYAGLAGLYEAHPDFVARYEALADGFSTFLPVAMRAYVGRRG